MALARGIVVVMRRSPELVPISGTPAPAPLPSPLQELRPVVHAARWPFGLDCKAGATVRFCCAIARAPAHGVVVRQQDQGFD
jgi:hypothetical protein